jgi:hypothetical protein
VGSGGRSFTRADLQIDGVSILAGRGGDPENHCGAAAIEREWSATPIGDAQLTAQRNGLALW